MNALDKKLWRELWNMRMQAIAIAMVLVGGIGVFVMSLSTLESLFKSREIYYQQHQFADVFSSLKRAPNSLVRRILDIPGVAKAETRVRAYVNIDVTGFADPVSGHLISLPDNSPGQLNQIYLQEGRLLESGRNNEILISKEFASAHQLQLGDTLSVTINGRQKKLTIVGLAQSPEYIYQIAPGALFPDYQRYGVMWMARSPLASAYGMSGAFNDLALTLDTHMDPQTVIDQLDTMLKPYGGIGAYAREDQLSNRFLSEELKQLRTMASVFPLIFFAVAAFLLNIVISRLISLQREQIASLKAFGYSHVEVGFHYSKLVMVMTAFGVMGGIAVGVWMGRGMSNLYQTFFSLPFLVYVLNPLVVLSAAIMSMLVAILGTLYSVRNVVRLAPAEAMRPEPPAVFRATMMEKLGLQDRLSQPTRMVLRHIERRPLRSFLTTLGIAMSCATMMMGGFQSGSMDHMVDVQFGMSQHEDMEVNYNEPVSMRALYSLTGLKGVEQAEGFRVVPAQLQFEHRRYRASIQGIQPGGRLMRLLDAELKDIEIPEHGVVMTDYLAELLHMQVGDMLRIEVLEGQRPVLEVPLVAVANQYIGVNVYMQLDSLNRLLGEPRLISGALLRTDQREHRSLYNKLESMPAVVGVVERKAAIQAFYDTMAETVLMFTFVSTLLGGSIAFGVVYNCMRITLSERSRELASLRVLGFKRSEIAYILLGEMFLLTLLAIPLGLMLGYGLCAYMAYAFNTDLYRVPLIINANTYAFAATIIVAASALSALMISHKLVNLDMVAVLKTKE